MVLPMLIVGFIFIILVSWAYLLSDCKKSNSIGPLPLPLLGNALIFLGDSEHFLKALRNLVAKYGNAVRVHLFTNRYIILANPKYIEPLILSNEFITKGRSYDHMKPWLGNGLLTAAGKRWKTHRKFLTPAFHFNILQNFFPVFCKNEKILTEKIRKKADGKPFDLFPYIAMAALDNVTESIMGVSVNAQMDSESNYVKAIENLTELVSERQRNPFVWNDFCFNVVYGRRQNKALSILRAQTTEVIEARRHELKNNNITSLPPDSELGIKNKQAFLDLLLLSEIDGRKICDEEIREEVDTFMFEGHDTTTSGIAFCLFCISKHIDVENKIFEEQKQIFGDKFDRDPTYSDLHKMKYLEQVIKESLRLYPSVPIIERQITEDSEIAGMTVPKNTSVVIHILEMQRNPDVHENPLQFRPDRFEDGSGKNGVNWLAFSAGPRNCIGQKFAMMEMKVTLAAIIRNFKLVASVIEPELCADLVLRSKNGVHVGFLPRN